MKTLILSAYDKSNGSARAAFRLHQGLQQVGADSQMLVQEKRTGDASVLAPKSKLAQGISKARGTFDAFPLKLYRKRTSTLMSLQWLPDNVASKVRQVHPDIINLHWANDAFLQIETFARLKKPIVWSLHDMWAFTGGCHYTQECDRYLLSCGSCPQLGSHADIDLSRWVWKRKRNAWKGVELTVVGLSSWLADCARKSALFRDTRVEIIPNGINIDIYRPLNTQIARQLLKLPQNKKLILFGAMNSTSDKRKGFQLLQSALSLLSQSNWSEQLELVVLGANRPKARSDFNFQVHYLGTLSDDLSLALAYSAADVFVAPSLQENLANTVMESLACGTPCVAFKVGGMPDMIEHRENGYLASPFDISDLTNGITWILENSPRHQHLCHRARQKVEAEFTLEIQARRYIRLFEELLKTS